MDYQRAWTWETLMVFNNVPDFILLHLQQFYFTLMCVQQSSYNGVKVDIFHNFGGWTTMIMFVASIICMCCLPTRMQKRRAFLLTVAAFFGGASLSLLIDSKHTLTIIATVVMEFALATRFFWMTAFLTNEGHSIYAALLVLLRCFRTAFVHTNDLPPWYYEVYVALLGYTYYMLVYSHELVDRARTDLDYVRHVITFFADFPAVVGHIFHLLWMDLVAERARMIRRIRRID